MHFFFIKTIFALLSMHETCVYVSVTISCNFKFTNTYGIDQITTLLWISIFFLNIILKITIFTRKIIEIFFLSFSDGNIKSCKSIEFSWRKLLKYWRKHAQLVILIDPNPYSLTLKKRKSLSLSLSLSLSHISQTLTLTLTLTLTITVFLEISSKNGSKEEDIFNPELARSPWVNELGDFTNAWQRYFQDISKGLQDLPAVK